MEYVQSISERVNQLKQKDKFSFDQGVAELKDKIRQTIVKLSTTQDFKLGWFYGEPLPEEDIEELCDYWLRKELEFVNLVFGRIIDWCSEDEKQVVLFDVDNTLCDVYNHLWIIRPSAELLLRLIKTIFPNVILGIMTNTPQESLDDYLDGSDRFGYSLTDLSSYFDRDWCFGIRSEYDHEARKMLYESHDKLPRLNKLRANGELGVHLVDDEDFGDEDSLCLGESKFRLEYYADAD